jgi:hypothetical protein
MLVMTVMTGAEVYADGAMFGFGPDGGLVMPQSPVEAWMEGRTEYVPQLERALVTVVPDSIDVQYRSSCLTESLEAIGQANQDKGFQNAAESDYHRERLQKQVGAAIDEIADELGSRSEAGMEVARRKFFAASGVGVLAVKGSDELSGPERLVRTHMSKQWGQFLDSYGRTGLAARKSRARAKQQYAKTSVYTTSEEN